MSLSCICDFDLDCEPGKGYYLDDSGDFIEFEPDQPEGCKSCGKQINQGDLCISFEFYRYPEDEEEAREYGFYDLEDSLQEEAPIRDPNDHICEKCGEIYLNLQSVGFECISPQENMQDLLKEFIAKYDPQPLYGESKAQKIERIKQRSAKKYGFKHDPELIDNNTQ